ncbi:MAG: PLDc_N domain-containing protein [Bacteroidales bacterium]|nr:PLDc_N domain-containing protein [Bacteroidales bacterium]
MTIQKTANIFGNIGTASVIIGMMLKIQHHAWASELFTVGYLIFMVFWVRLLVEIFRIDKSMIYKMIWTIIVLVVPIIGAWIYYHFEFIKKRRSKEKESGIKGIK